MLRFLALVFLLSSSLCVSSLAFGALVTFEGLLSNPNSFYNGGPNTNNNGFAIGDVYFPNDYIATFGAWDGWAYSNVVNTTTQSFTNQYAAWPGMGSNGSSTYGLGYVFQPTYVSFATPVTIQSADLANTTWTALTMLNGDPPFSKKFGGPSGNDPDFLVLTIEGRSGAQGAGAITGAVEFALADFRAANNTLDFIRSGWTTVGLASLGTVQSLRFSIESSDVGQFGINTPTYFAIDNLSYTPIPEPSSWLLIGVACLLTVNVSRRRGR